MALNTVYVVFSPEETTLTWNDETSPLSGRGAVQGAGVLAFREKR